uniref:Ig-like domain-containing protein n=1 Tax=Oryzias latipes TaxID=8090 RepID=A0A3B3I6M3_ORYLA
VTQPSESCTASPSLRLTGAMLGNTPLSPARTEAPCTSESTVSLSRQHNKAGAELLCLKNIDILIRFVARFHARVSSMPKPEISWFHNRQPVFPTKNVVFHFDEVTSTATLIIVDAFSEHAGQYTCRAANNAGEAVCSATLTITREEEGNSRLVQPDSIPCPS